MSVSLLRWLGAICALVTMAALPGCSCGGDDIRCGNGVLEGSEQCDDGNTASGDGCSTNCVAEGNGTCGNGQLEFGEACDDGNVDDYDGCSATCAIELCGNGIMDAGEECDDGNHMDLDGCSITCTSEGECGNGIPEPGEECDDGNTVQWDGCEDNCLTTPPEVTCQDVAPIASGVCEVTPGDASTLIVGDLLSEVTIFKGGQVLIDPTGQIVCAGCSCTPMAQGATQVVCPQGVISPALINPHDHITYTHNMPYTDTGERYEHRHDWRLGIRGHTKISSSGGASQDRIRWGELRFMMGGATAIAGSGSAPGVLRNVDRSDQEGLNQPPVDYSTFPLGDTGGTLLNGTCSYPNIETAADIAGDDAYFPHISEGVDIFARNEFLCTSSTDNGGEDLLEPQSAYIHAIGLTPLDYSAMAQAGTSLIWSPRSNITLYGETAKVTTAARLGVRIALGTDWIPTGSMNMQRELQCADSLNKTYYDNFFDDRDLWRMVTRSAAEAAAVDDVIGKLEPGLVADIAIFDGSVNSGFRAVIDAKPGDVALVMRGGEAMYGDDAVVTALNTGTCDPLDVCGTGKRVCLVDDIGKNLADLTTAVGSMYPLFFCDTPMNEPSCKPTRPDSVNGSTVYTGDVGANDSDGDGIVNASDNCPLVFNPIRPMDEGVQADFDGDGDGDACDVCPLAADNANCPVADPNDSDSDGVPDATDNCVDVPNPQQLDGDMDGRGDACDACPAVSNPAPEACPVTIYDVKQGLVTGDVGIDNALVTGCSDGNGFFIQIVSGDTGYTGPDYSGAFVYDPSVVCTGGSATVEVGDRVDLNPATVSNFFGQIQLTSATVTVLSSGAPAPTPVSVTAAAAGGTMPTSLEAVLVQLSNVVVTEVEPLAGPGDSNPNNEFVVDGALRVNDYLHLVNPLPAVNTVYSSLTGILDYRNGNSKLEPRGAGDLVLGAPVLVGFDPSPSFARQGAVGQPTIPTPLTVSLSGPAVSNTFVAIGTAAPSNLTVVGGGVTIPAGMSSAPVLVDALLQSPSVGLTATLSSNVLNADVRVVGPAEQPQVVSLSPASSAVAPLGVLSLQVLLDIPAANPGGNSVSLGLSPGTFGSVPGSVTVAADQLTANFSFTAGMLIGTETVTANLNGGMASALVDVTTGGGLVINEVDYDQIGTDADEFVEILNATPVPVNLNGVALVMVNGSNNNEYERIDLSPAGTLAAGEYLVVGSATLLATLPMSTKTVPFNNATNNVQNGAPDAIGILDVASSTLYDALSYEGSITMGNVVGAGVLSFVEGNPTAISDSNTAAGSLIRDPNGIDTDDQASDWAFTSTITPGAVNVP